MNQNLDNKDNSGLELNLYDLNKSIISQMTPLSISEINAKREMIINYYNKSGNIYHMLLCRDYNYYTIFAHDHMKTFPDFSCSIKRLVLLHAYLNFSKYQSKYLLGTRDTRYCQFILERVCTVLSSPQHSECKCVVHHQLIINLLIIILKITS